jgi:uncharacterized short protein YbdD (DUF466 family)
MKKKYFFLIVLGIGVGIYFNSKHSPEPTYTDFPSDTPAVVSPLGTTAMPVNPTSAQTPQPEEQKKAIPLDKNFEEYDQIEKNWLLKMNNMFGEKDYQFYLDLRARNEEEKMQAYKEFHDYLRQKYGDKFSYHISDDQSVREKAINTRYTRDLLKKVGEEKFKLYLKARDEFNEALERKSPSGHALIIEF